MSGGTLAFFILAAFGLGGVTTMLTARRVIHMVLALSLSFLAIAGLYVLLGADFLGVVQIIVYTGAITILAVFGIMLTPHGGLETEPKSAPRQGRRMPLVAFLLAAGLFAVLFWAVAGTRFARSPFASDEPVDAAAIGGLLLSSRYLLPFEVISVVLLVALIGAIVLAKDDASDTAGSVQAEEHAGTSPAEPPTVRADNAEAHRADRTAASARDTGESGQHVEKEAQLVGAVRGGESGMTPSELMQYLLFSAMLFVLGMFGALTRRNTVIVLLSIELMLNAANINLVALSRFLPGGAENARLPHPSLAGDFSATLGQTVALFTIAVAAAEVAVGLAALIAFYRLKASPNVDEMDSLKR